MTTYECDKEEKEGRVEKEIGLKLLKQRTVLLTGEINRESAQRVIAQLMILSDEAPDDPIKLLINSPGGDADAGYAIFDIVRYIGTPVKMVAAGLAASAAVIVLLASPRERRLSLPNARFMIHQPSTGVQGAATDIQIEASEILKFRDKINQLIAHETGQSVEKVAADTQRNFWMSAEQALQYGLIGKVVSKAQEL